jgi:hypothetical protein
VGQPPKTKSKARALARRKRALDLLSEGHSIASIAQTLNITERAVRLHLTAALASESRYGSGLSPEQIQEFRAEQCEKINRVWFSGMTTLKELEDRIGGDHERSLDATSHARMISALMQAAERFSKLTGIDVPQKAIVETFSVNLERSEKTITISFDAGALEPPSEPIPGLSVWRNGQLVEGPGNESAGFEPGFGLNGHVMTAGALPNAPESSL